MVTFANHSFIYTFSKRNSCRIKDEVYVVRTLFFYALSIAGVSSLFVSEGYLKRYHLGLLVDKILPTCDALFFGSQDRLALFFFLSHIFAPEYIIDRSANNNIL